MQGEKIAIFNNFWFNIDWGHLFRLGYQNLPNSLPYKQKE